MVSRVPVAVVLLVVAATPAAAATDGQLSLAAASSFTDNARGARDGRQQSDVFFSVTPALLLNIDSPRLAGNASLAATVSRYVNQTDVSSLSLAGQLGLSYDIARRARSTFTLSGGYSKTPAVTSGDIAGVLPEGGAEYVAIGASGAISGDLSARWRAVDTARSDIHLPVGAAGGARSNLALAATLGVQYAGPRDAYEISLTAGTHLYLDEEAARDAPRGDHNFALQAAWVRELSPFWNVRASGGAAAVVAGDLSLAPLAAARISYQRLALGLFAEVAQSLQANTLVSRTFSATSASAGLSATFPALTITILAGSSHNRSVGGEGASNIDGARGAASVRWTLRENIGLTAGYEVAYQVGGDAHLLRNVVNVGLVAYWPTLRQRPAPLSTPAELRRDEEAERPAD